MTELINRTVQFLKKTLHTNVKISGTPEISRVPFLFRENYNFFRINLEKFGQIVLVIDQQKRTITPAVIQKEMESISENLKKMSVYVNDVMDFNKRDRLIKYNVPFIVPGKQIYIPGAGLSLTENYQPAKRKADYLSPSSVCVINYIINQSSVTKTFPLRMLSANLGYSAMTISRSFDELRNFGLIAVNRTAREVIGIAELLPVTILEKALPFLKPVVKDIVYLKVQNKDLDKYVLVSGITALSEYTDLNAGKIKSYAGNSKLLKMILEKKMAYEVIFPEDASAEFQVWRYKPVAGAGKYSNFVDPAGLCFLFRDNEDERVQIALDKVKKLL